MSPRFIRPATMLVAGCVVLAPRAARAQDISATPFSTMSLSTGFTPDPRVQSVTAGGNVHTDRGGCSANVSARPDLNLSFQAGSLPLTISANSGEDVVLIVNDPSGNWHCDDDSGDGTNARLTFTSPRSGLYNIWVGTFGSGYPSAQIAISEIGAGGGGGGGGATGGSMSGGLNVGQTPTYGVLELSAGFTPDPQVRQITAGGNTQASVSGCGGYAATRPDLNLVYHAGSLPLTIGADAGEDVVLIVNGPNGEWYCDDDSGDGTNSLLTFPSPRSGTYNIWVATFSAHSGSLPPAHITVSEVGAGGGGGGSSYVGGGGNGGLNVGGTPTYGSVNLRAGFTPDPYQRSIRAGGADHVPSSLGSGCSGYVNGRAPDFNLNYQAGSSQLNLYATSGADITLVVNLPNGSWVCADDDNGTNPLVHLSSPQSGQYNIWIGTFAASHSPLPESTLYISELSPSW